jgi:hypothetical protein
MATTSITPSPKFSLRFQVYSDGHALPSSPPIQPNPHTTFSFFAHLPPELRLQIWAHLLSPRILIISCIEPSTAAEQAAALAARPSARLVPVLLHVNREARTLALSHYELAFSWKVPTVLADMDLLSPPTPSSSPRRSRGSGGAVQPVVGAPTWSEPRVYFNFARDAVYLLGELEPCTESGFNSPMTYFLSRADTARVRRVAIAFRALGFGENGTQQIFGTLFHVVDRLKPADGRVLVCVTEADEWTHALMGGDAPLIPGGDGHYDYRYAMRERVGDKEDVNVVQKIWRDWYRGSIVTSSLAEMEFNLIREAELERYMSESIDGVSSAQ